jgi:hypothetical protein
MEITGKKVSADKLEVNILAVLASAEANPMLGGSNPQYLMALQYAAKIVSQEIEFARENA